MELSLYAARGSPASPRIDFGTDQDPTAEADRAQPGISGGEALSLEPVAVEWILLCLPIGSRRRGGYAGRRRGQAVSGVLGKAQDYRRAGVGRSLGSCHAAAHAR